MNSMCDAIGMKRSCLPRMHELRDVTPINRGTGSVPIDFFNCSFLVVGECSRSSGEPESALRQTEKNANVF